MPNGLKKTINVGFLFQQNSSWMGGINYFKNLFTAMSKVDNPRIIPFIPKPIDKKAKVLLEYAQIATSKETKSLEYWLKVVFYKLIFKKVDTDRYVKKTYYNLDLTSHSQILKSIPSISWIPDFQHLYLPSMFNKKEVILRKKIHTEQARESKIVILSSLNALNDFKKCLPEYAHKGRVLNFVAILDKDIYKRTNQIKEKVIEKFSLPEKYFYLPNQFWKHKNHIAVYKAISILKNEGIDIKVVFSGNIDDYRHKGFFGELNNFAQENNIKNNIKLVGLIESDEVYCLMRNCISIINPSLFEGWSTSVEEAKSLGKNIILSNLNVHMEQNPIKAAYFDPSNPKELAGILKEKWQNGNSGPDFDLEEIAKNNMEERILNYGKQYQKIVLEALKE